MLRMNVGNTRRSAPGIVVNCYKSIFQRTHYINSNAVNVNQQTKCQIHN